MYLKKLLFLHNTLIFIASVLLTCDLSAEETYTIATSEKLKFTYSVSGVPIAGEFYIDKSSFTINFNEEAQSSFYIKIDIRKSTAGFPLATKAMLGPSVLNAEKYPFMEFKSTHISKKQKGYELRGLLSLKGIKKNVIILVGSEKKYKKNTNILKFSIKSSINRNEFGADGYSFLVGKNIILNSNINLILKE